MSDYTCECVILYQTSIGQGRRKCQNGATTHGIWRGAEPGAWTRMLCCGSCIAHLLRNAPPNFTHDPTAECADPDAYFDAVENRCRRESPELVEEVEAFLRHPVAQTAEIGASC